MQRSRPAARLRWWRRNSAASSQMRSFSLAIRFETAAAALAATLELVPIVHLYGGEETEGAFDNSLRHCITKLSHLHFVSHEVTLAVLSRWVSTLSESMLLGVWESTTRSMPGSPRGWSLEARLGIQLKHPLGVVTLHPTTLARLKRPGELQAVIAAIESFPATWVVTLPNADPGGEAIRTAFLTWPKGNKRRGGERAG